MTMLKVLVCVWAIKCLVTIQESPYKISRSKNKTQVVDHVTLPLPGEDQNNCKAKAQ